MTEWLGIGLILVSGLAVSRLSQKYGFPNAVAQTVLGIFLGSSLLGWIPHSTSLHVLGEIGVILMLGVAGMQLGIERLKSTGWSGVLVAFIGLVLSLGGGYAVGIVVGTPQAESLYIGLALAATSIGVTVQVLSQYGLMSSKVADVIIAAAVLDDVFALYLLGIAHGLLSVQISVVRFAAFLSMSLIVLAALYFVSQALTRRMSRTALFAHTPVRALWALGMIGLGAGLTHAIDLSSVVGAFFAGVGTRDGLETAYRDQVSRSLQPVLMIMVPFFFVMIGVQAQWQSVQSLAMWDLVIVLTLVAILAKLIGGLLGSYSLASWNERWTVGLGMVPRGEVGLVVITLGFAQGHLSHATFVVLVFVTILVTALGPLLMAPVAHHLSRKTFEGTL